MDVYVTKDYWEHRYKESELMLERALDNYKNYINNLKITDDITGVVRSHTSSLEPIIKEYEQAKLVYEILFERELAE